MTQRKKEPPLSLSLFVIFHLIQLWELMTQVETEDALSLHNLISIWGQPFPQPETLTHSRLFGKRLCQMIN